MQYTNLIWRDGQPFSEMFDDIYYSSNEGENISGEREFNHVFFKNNGLPERWQTGNDFVIAELGFGSGLNCLLTIRAWLQHLADTKQTKCLHYIAIEKYPLSAETIVTLISRYPELKTLCDELVENYPPAVETSHSRRLFDGKVVIHYKFMDVFAALKDEQFHVDAWYLDGFTPARNTDMWSQALFLKLAQNSNQGARCSTYTAAGFVKRNFMAAGFEVTKVPGYGKKREMLVAVYKGAEKKAFNYKDRPWFRLPEPPVVKRKHATVIGAGIAGLSAAYALIRRGWQVTIIDRHEAVAKEASSNPVALVYPRLSINNKFDTDFYIAAYYHALYELDKLQSNSPQQFWFDTGLSQVMDKTRITEIINRFEFNQDVLSISERSINSNDVNQKEKVVVDIKKAGVVMPGVLCETIKAKCGDKLTIKQATVEQIKPVDGGWQCLADSQLIDEAEILIVANGVSLNALGGLISFPVEEIRGQVVALRANTLSQAMVSSVNAEVYLTPSINNFHYLGASYTRGNDNAAIDADDTAWLLKKLADNVTAEVVADVFSQLDCVDAWVGFRAMSKDRVPIVGGVPDASFYHAEYADICHGNVIKSYLGAQYMNGLYVTSAHGSRGFTSSFLAAEIIASQIQGEPAPVAKRIVDYLSPSRFIVNQCKRR